MNNKQNGRKSVKPTSANVPRDASHSDSSINKTNLFSQGNLTKILKLRQICRPSGQGWPQQLTAPDNPSLLFSKRFIATARVNTCIYLCLLSKLSEAIFKKNMVASWR